MERRVIAGAAATLLVVVAGAVANFATEGDFVVAVLLAGMAGGLVTGLLSRSGRHVGVGARAGAYGGSAAFALFLLIGSSRRWSAATSPCSTSASSRFSSRSSSSHCTRCSAPAGRRWAS